MVATQGVAFAASGRGLAGRPALVLMHFLGGSGREWDEVVALLGDEYRTLAVDMPGFGGSAEMTDFSVAEMADALAAMISEARLDRYVLVGHSMSGKVAMVLARRLVEAGERGLEGLVLVAPSPPSPEPMDDTKRTRMIDALGTRHEDDLARARAYITKNEERDIPARVEARASREVLRMNRAAWMAWLESGSREDWAGFVDVLELPALVIAGEKDLSLGPDLQQRLTLPHLAQGELRVVAGCSHLVPMERPEAMASLLAEFVARVSQVSLELSA